MNRRILLSAVLVFLGIFALSELLLPYFIGKQVEAGLSKAFGTNEITASVKASPALSMLGGNFSRITVNGKNIHMEKLAISQLSAVFTNTSIDLNKLTTNRSLVFRNIGSFDGTIILQEEDLNKYVAQTVKGIKNAHVTLVPESMKVTGDLVIGPAIVAVAMDGKLRGEQTQLKYSAEQLLVNNAVVGMNLAGSGLTEFLLFDMKKLPVPASIRDVIIDQGQVVIRISK